MTTTLLRLIESGKSFSGAVLEAGTYDVSAQTPAGRTISDEYFIEAYVGHVDDRTLLIFLRHSATSAACRLPSWWSDQKTWFWLRTLPWWRGCRRPLSTATSPVLLSRMDLQTIQRLLPGVLRSIWVLGWNRLDSSPRDKRGRGSVCRGCKWQERAIRTPEQMSGFWGKVGTRSAPPL